MFDATKLQKKLPHLADYGKDVESWMTEFVKVMELYDIMEPRRIFIWVKEAVEEDVKGALSPLVVRRGDETRYPSFKEIQDAIEEHLHITENDKCAILKSLQINQEETIKKFNYRYKKLYNKLSLEYRRLISVKDYTNAISSRVFPCSRVMIAECDTINEACKIAEVAEEAEKEINNINQRNEFNNMGNHIMLTQNQFDNSLLMRHPIYENLQLGQLSIKNNNNNLLQGGNNRNSKFRSWNNNNNFRNPNYVAHMNNAYGHSNYYLNNSNDINKMDNGNLTNHYNSRFNYNNVSNHNNISQYMNNNNKYNMNNMSNNQAPNEIRDHRNNPYLNNMNNNMRTTINEKEYDKQRLSNNKINTNNMTQSFNYQNGNNYNNRMGNNNIINTLVTSNKINNSNNNNHVNCYRCTMNGHRASECPYTFKQLAELEEKGLINKPLNQ